MDIHYTVLPFFSGTGEAVLCAIIFKSKLDISEIPISWKIGIDITCNIEVKAAVMHGGLSVILEGNAFPAFMACCQRPALQPLF
jgi:hypothetical protein